MSVVDVMASSIFIRLCMGISISTIFSPSVFPLNRRNGLNTSDKSQLLYFISYTVMLLEATVITAKFELLIKSVV